MAWFEDSTLYVQVYANRFVLQSSKQDGSVEKAGDFSHPRMLIGRFDVASNTLKQGSQALGFGSLMSARPRIVMHPKELLEGGLTEIEVRVLQELGITAGGRQVVVWQGPNLDRAGFSKLPFPKPGIRSPQVLTPADLPR